MAAWAFDGPAGHAVHPATTGFFAASFVGMPIAFLIIALQMETNQIKIYVEHQIARCLILRLNS